MSKPRDGRRTTPAGPFHPGSGLVVAALCTMVCLVPLVLSLTVYESVFSLKLLFLHLSVLLASIGWLVQTRWGMLARLAVPRYLLIPAILWMAAGLISSPGTTHPLDTVVELVNQALLLVLLFIVASALPLSRATPVLAVSAATGLLVSVFGIFQYHGVGFLWIPSAALPSATFTNRNFAAEYLICAIPLAGLLFLATRNRLTQAMSGASACLMGVFLVYTRTRSAWVGFSMALLAVGAAVALHADLREAVLEARDSCLDRGKKRAILAFAALFIGLAVLPPMQLSAVTSQSLPYLPDTKVDIATTARSILQEEKEASRDHSRDERLAMWSTTCRMVAANPILGVGPGGWKRNFPSFDRGTTISPITFPRWPHNDFLGIASELGLFGLGVYLWFLSGGLRCVLGMARGRDLLARIAAPAFAVSILAVLGDALFAFPRDMPHAVMFPYLLFGLAAGEVSRGDDGGSTSRRSAGTPPAFLRLLPFVFVLISAGAVEISRRRVTFDRYYYDSLYQGQIRRNWPAFLGKVQAALDQGGFRPHLWFFRGIGLQNLERYPEAESAYRKALAYTPYAWFVHAGLGSVCLQQGHLQEALKHCLAGLAICPTALDVRSNLALIYQQMGDQRRAREEIRAVIEANPRDARAHHYLGNLYVAAGRLDSARACYERALSGDPIPQTYANLADVYRLQGRPGEALPFYLKAALAFPNNASIQWGLGLSLASQGQPQQAEAAYRKAISLNPDYPQSYFDLGNLLGAQGREAEAIAAYRAFLRLWRGDASFGRFASEQIVRMEKPGKM